MFGFFRKMLQKNPSELFGQRNNFPLPSEFLADNSVIQNRLIRQNIQNLLTFIPHTYMYNIIYIIYNILYTHTQETPRENE